MSSTVNNSQLALRQFKRIRILAVEGGDVHELGVKAANGSHHLLCLGQLLHCFRDLQLYVSHLKQPRERGMEQAELKVPWGVKTSGS